MNSRGQSYNNKNISGTIQISDGILIIQGGTITDVSNIDTNSLNTSSLTSETQTINGDLTIIGDNATSYTDPTCALILQGGATISQNLYSDQIFTHHLHADDITIDDIDISGNFSCSNLTVNDTLTSNITNINNSVAISGESVAIAGRCIFGDSLIVNTEITTQSINLLNADIKSSVGQQQGYIGIKINHTLYYIPFFSPPNV